MPSIGDSDAFKDSRRILSQHQAALTILQDRLSNPETTTFRWLDLACGRGQIICNLAQNLSQEARKKLHYEAYDIEQQFVREVMKDVDQLGLASHDAKIGAIHDFSQLYKNSDRFDLITFTNTIHEVRPDHFGNLLSDCVRHLSPHGTLFIYDMERINPPELGAVAWTKEEVTAIIRSFCQALGVPTYLPEVGRWHHASCEGWNVHLVRTHLRVSDEELVARTGTIADQVRDTIRGLLTDKLNKCRLALESLTRGGGGTTSQETEQRQRLLHDFWALNRALRVLV